MNASTFAIPLMLSLAAGAAAAGDGHHELVRPNEMKWADVPSLPPGARISMIEGPMNQATPFTVRLKFPANYRIPPHTHPAVERVTVISGTFHLGMGATFDQAKAQPLPAGAIAIMQPGMPHFVWTSAETEVQLHGTGPWGITYVQPADDPRKQ
jgi:quercetin dioxygenase-like cupin family protein